MLPYGRKDVFVFLHAGFGKEHLFSGAPDYKLGLTVGQKKSPSHSKLFMTSAVMWVGRAGACHN